MALVTPRGAGAQISTAPTAPAASSTGKGQIVGVVVDSLKGGYLSGADIVVEGGRAATETDSVGRFRVDSLAPGTYHVGVFHTRLDTLGITLLTQPFRVGADSTSIVLLAVPSATTLIRRSCRIQSGPYGESAVVGRVMDPENLQPVGRAEVSIAWIEIEVSKESGVRRSPLLRRDSTDALGAFRICGLPSSMQATLQARRGSALTGEIPISLGDRPVELLARTLLLSPTESGAQSGNAAVSGTVTLENSRTNDGARVEVVGTDIAATTNEKGDFSLRKIPSGSKVLLIRHVGFAEEIVPVDLSSREEKRVTVNLSRFVEVMDPVLVKARRTVGLERVGFNQREKSGMGFYIGPERLVGSHPRVLSDILRLVPGLRVDYGEHGDIVSTARGAASGCVQYYLDDQPYVESRMGDVNRFVTASDVRAVEVYQGLATPAQFDRPGASCTTIVIWTRWKLRG
jgi:hypothetical protein